MKLWGSEKNNSNTKISEMVEKFTAGEDVLYDQMLVNYDVIGSIAHATMLKEIGILTNEELIKLKSALRQIISLNRRGKFKIETKDEDVHTKTENFLTEKLGETGKKLHTGRSRNDQILVDLRLYTREKLLSIEKNLLNLCNALLEFGRKNSKTPMPGYTHFRKAMPSSVGLWACSFVEALLDDLETIKCAYTLNNQNPLGSAAGYGVHLNIDRNLTTSLLGFEKVQNNVLYVQNSRGKIESIVLAALTQVMLDLGKLSNELVIFSTDEFDFFSIPEEFCTGSSIMPKKRNPDVLELVRARSAKVFSNYIAMITTIKDLFSGYNRDMQETKEPLLKSLHITNTCLKILVPLIKKLGVNRGNLLDAFTPQLFTADEAIKLVKYDIPFREAYKQIDYNFHELKIDDPVKGIQLKKHIGAPGNLNTKKLGKKIKKELRLIDYEKNMLIEKMNILLK